MEQIFTHMARMTLPLDVTQKWAKIVSLWWRYARTRRALNRLDDRMLADIGITREQAKKEAAKPFWRP